MSGSDNILFNVRERPLSTDQNNAQSMIHRAILDVERYAQSIRTYAAGVKPTEVPRNFVAGGLIPIPSANDIAVQPGVLFQDSGTLAPVPGSLDSNYRVGFLRSSTIVDMPDPGSETWYLLEAQMVEVVSTTESRDILDPGAGNFVATMVSKQVERRVSFQLLTGAGGNLPAPSGGDWVPIAMVRRPAGGGAVVASDIVDCRRLACDLAQHQQNRRGRVFMETRSTQLTDSLFVKIKAEAFINGQHLWIDTNDTGVDLSSAPIKDPTTGAFTVLAWYYLYLVPWQGSLLPSGRYGNASHRGALVLSHVEPANQGEETNGAVLNLPTPFGVSTVAAGGAVCIGALKMKVGGVAWYPMYLNNGRALHQIFSAVNNPIAAPGASVAVNLRDGAAIAKEAVPKIARGAILRLETAATGGGTAGQSVDVEMTGGSIGMPGLSSGFGDWTNSNSFTFEFGLQGQTAVELATTGATRPSSFALYAHGYLI